MIRNLSLAAMLCPLLILAACNEAPFEAERGDFQQADVMAQFDKRGPAEMPLGAQLAQVRAATAKYHDFDANDHTGWFLQLSPCVEHPELGGMGYHYGNPAYLEDEVADILRPQVLLYEPMKNGKLRLVGVEYITGADAVFDEDEQEYLRPDGAPPMLFGEEFHWNAHQGFWALHVWVWRNNPSGMFADWNPKVSCEYAN